MPNLNHSSASDYPNQFPQFENKKKYLPAENVSFPHLTNASNLTQFYLPPDLFSVANQKLYHRDQKKPLTTFSFEELKAIEGILSLKKTKATLRLSDQEGEKKAFLSLKVDQRDPAKPSTNPSDALICNQLFEKEIDYKIATNIYKEFTPRGQQIISKVRHQIVYILPEISQELQTFTVDFFRGPLDTLNPDRRVADNAGLVLIEQKVSDLRSTLREHLPRIFGKDVTQDSRSTNSRLSQKPYARWSDEEKRQFHKVETIPVEKP